MILKKKISFNIEISGPSNPNSPRGFCFFFLMFLKIYINKKFNKIREDYEVKQN